MRLGLRIPRRRTVMLLSAVLVSLFCICAFVVYDSLGLLIGGLPGTYNAVDGDWLLTRKAKSALPIIAAINRCRADHGKFPSDADELSPYLPDDAITPKSQNIHGWIYRPEAKPPGYWLFLRTGWDSGLEYHGTDSGSSWDFEPGDGDPKKFIKLNP